MKPEMQDLENGWNKGRLISLKVAGCY